MAIRVGRDFGFQREFNDQCFNGYGGEVIQVSQGDYDPFAQFSGEMSQLGITMESTFEMPPLHIVPYSFQ